MNGFDDVIKQLEEQKAAIERALEALREVGGEVSAVGPAPATPAAPAAPLVDKRSAGQKARWAAKRAAEAASAPTKRKGGISTAGRKRLAEAMKRRWAAKRTAAQAKKRARPKKAA